MLVVFDSGLLSNVVELSLERILVLNDLGIVVCKLKFVVIGGVLDERKQNS